MTKKEIAALYKRTTSLVITRGKLINTTNPTQSENWSEAEDAIIANGIENGLSYAAITAEIKLQGKRANLQSNTVRNRWIDVLVPALVKGRNWTAEEDAKIADGVRNGMSFSDIATVVKGRTHVAIESRWNNVLNATSPPKGNSGYFSAAEDAIICAEHRLFADGVIPKLDYGKIADKLFGKTEKQARLRWTTVLDPLLIKGNWTEEEDVKIAIGVGKKDKIKYSHIATTIPGRTNIIIRRRWVKKLVPVIEKGQRSWTEEEGKIYFVTSN